ncbi:MAG: hypothetical protein HYR63_00355 [Proteobacteria bacterium]|nr:hypothetical protein [Pseudomonadota bacterium]
MADKGDRNSRGDIRLPLQAGPISDWQAARRRAAAGALLDLVFDDLGRPWPIASAPLGISPAQRAGSLDLAEFAVRTLGWVGVRFGVDEIAVRLDPTVLSSSAAVGAMAALADTRRLPVRLRLPLTEGWASEIFAGASAAITRIEQLAKGSESSVARFVFMRQPTDIIFRGRNRALIHMLQLARNATATIARADAVALAEADPDRRTTMVWRRIGADRHTPPNGTGWTFESVAAAMRIYREEERRNLIGADTSFAADPDFARWCAAAYRRAEEAGEPIVEDVRALVGLSVGTAIETTYRRLLLPFRAAEGGTLVAVRFERVAEPLAA